VAAVTPKDDPALRTAEDQFYGCGTDVDSRVVKMIIHGPAQLKQLFDVLIHVRRFSDRHIDDYSFP
jgi:hypothetical protein